MTAEIAYKYRTNSHTHGNAYFRLEARIGNYGRMYSPRFLILAQRPRVYEQLLSMMQYGRISSFLSDPHTLGTTDREIIVDSFCNAMKSIPSSESLMKSLRC
jgi:hypothetical protein